MSDFAGQEPTSEELQQPSGGEEVSIQTEDHSQEQEPQVESNPFWKEVEDKLGPKMYQLIQPSLTRADAEASKRISALNQQLAPWKQYADQGITPDQVNGAFGVVQKLNDPNGQLEIYQALQTFLKEEGRLPNEQELAQEIQDNRDESLEEEDPRDARIKQLQEQLEQFQGAVMGQFQTQKQIRIQQEADSWADSEWNRIAKANPDLKNEDFAEIANILAAQTNRGQAPDLDAAVSHYTALRDRIRTTPRPSQSAPRVPSGPGGGTPGGGAIDTSKMSAEQRRELAAAVLARSKAQG